MNADSKTKGVPEELLNDTNFRFSEHYKFRSLLGQGGFGVVVLATSKATCENMAVKIIEKDKISTVEVDKIKGEAEMLNSLDNQHIVKFKELHESENKLYIAMEYLSGGSLRDMIQRHAESGGKLKEFDASRIVKGVLEAVAYLHDFDIAHRDLKPDNIMFAKQNDIGSLKLIDFGLSAKYNGLDIATLTDKCGTAIYMAPEVFTNYQYSKYVDLWSVGMIMYILLSGKHPLYESSDVMDKYLVKLKSPAWTFPADFSLLAQHLFSKLAKLNPLERYTAKEALGHPWISRQPGSYPLSFADSIVYDNSKAKLINVLSCCFFAAKSAVCSPARAQAELSLSEMEEEYSGKITRISAQVAKWHEERAIPHNVLLESDDEILKRIEAVLSIPQEPGTHSPPAKPSQSATEMFRLSLFPRDSNTLPISCSDSSAGGDGDSPSELQLKHVKILGKGAAHSSSPFRGPRRVAGGNSPVFVCATETRHYPPDAVRRAVGAVGRGARVKAAAEAESPLLLERTRAKDFSRPPAQTRPRANSLSPGKKGGREERAYPIKHKRLNESYKKITPNNTSPPVQTEELKYLENGGTFSNYATFSRKERMQITLGSRGRETVPVGRGGKGIHFDALVPSGMAAPCQLPSMYLNDVLTGW